jgi:hypothetical protein
MADDYHTFRDVRYGKDANGKTWQDALEDP